MGGGYTGLWTAYYLKKAAPFLHITVLEAKFCGYGASGRNGGWLYNGIAGRDRYARLHGHDQAVRLQRAMNDTVDEVVRAAAEEKIDADIHRGGVLEVAHTPAQLARLQAFHSAETAFGETDRVLRGARETAERIRVTGAVGSTWTPHGARLHPVKLVTGLAAAVEALGVTIHESTPVTEIRPKYAVTPYGTVRAPYILRCTEGFTAALKGSRRTWLPMNSSMIATEPLSDEVWDTIGWEGRETLGDMAHAYMYAQRTADGRIALGGRGHPYRFGSRTDNDGRTRPATVEALREILVRFFPTTAERPHRPRVVGRPRRAPRLVRDRHPGPRHGPGLGGRVRRLGRRDRQPRRAHPARPGAAGLRAVGRDRTDHAPVGEPQGPRVGTGAVPVAGRPRHVRGLPHGGPPRVDGPQHRHGPDRPGGGPVVGAVRGQRMRGGERGGGGGTVRGGRPPVAGPCAPPPDVRPRYSVSIPKSPTRPPSPLR